MIITNFIINFAKIDNYGTSLRCLMGTGFYGGFGKIEGAERYRDRRVKKRTCKEWNRT